MMSRLMLNLHETADLGIWSTQRTTYGTGTRETEETQRDVIELDTILTGNTVGERNGTTRGSVPVLVTIDEEQV